MTIEDELKDIIIKKSGSVNKFANDYGIAQSTLASVFTRGVNKANVNTIIKICQALHISADELACGRIVPIECQKAELDTSRLTKENLDLLIAYYKALLDTQGDDNGDT